MSSSVLTVPEREATEAPDAAPDHLLTLPQLAERLALSPRSVQRRAKAAGIAPVTRRQGVDLYAADVAETLAETSPSGAPGSALATEGALAPAVERLVVSLQEAHAAALDAERRRGDEAAAERDRLRAELATERAARLALLERAATTAAQTASGRPWWRFWGVEQEGTA